MVNAAWNWKVPLLCRRVCYAQIKAQQTEPVAINIFCENQSHKNSQLFIHK